MDFRTILNDDRGVQTGTVPTVLLVDAAAMRRALRETLTLEDSVRIVGETASLDEAVRVAERLRPDIVVLDAETADLDPADAIRVLRQRAPDSALIVVTIEPDWLVHVVDDLSGVEAVGKVDGSTALLGTIRRVARRVSDAS